MDKGERVKNGSFHHNITESKCAVQNLYFKSYISSLDFSSTEMSHCYKVQGNSSNLPAAVFTVLDAVRSQCV